MNAFLVDKPPVPMTEPHPMLGGRYSLERPLSSSEGSQRWMAIEASSGRLVVVALAEPGRLSTFGRGVTHRHLVSVIDVAKEISPHAFPAEVSMPLGAGYAVAEHMPGRSLRSLLESGALHPAKAVAWTLRLADAVQALHAAGAVHGAISPRSVVAEPTGRAIVPVLSQLIAPPVGAFCPPERLRGAPESASDDVWGLCATLYTMLTGKLPFAGTTRDELLRSMGGKPAPLAAAGVVEPVLQEIVSRGLLGERRMRATDLTELQQLLDNWEREPTRLPPPRPPARGAPRGLGEIVAGKAFGPNRDDGILIDDASRPDDQGATVHDETEAAELLPESRPPTKPASVLAALEAPLGAAVPHMDAAPRVAPQRRLSFNPFERKQSVWPWVVVAALAGGGGVYIATGAGSKPEAAPVASAVEAAPPVAAPKPVVKRDADVVRNECVLGHFPTGSFESGADFGFVCQDGDFPATARHLYSLAHDPAATDDSGLDGGLDAGLKLDVVRLGGKSAAAPHAVGLDWYELPATAIIRKTCCPHASPVILPETTGWCEQLQTVVRRLADDSAKSVDLGPGARSFDRAVGCLFASHVKQPYGYTAAPSSASRAMFQQFLSRAAIVSARR